MNLTKKQHSTADVLRELSILRRNRLARFPHLDAAPDEYQRWLNVQIAELSAKVAIDKAYAKVRKNLMAKAA